MSSTCDCLSQFLCHFLCHIRRYNTERTRPVEYLTESDQEFSPAVTFDKVFDRLPIDIFHHIADFLPLDSVACLTLTRKKLASVIGHRTWPALRAKECRKERLNFLYTMQRDLKEWVLCFQCEKLHPTKQKPLLRTERHSVNEDLCSEADGIIELLPNYGLRWQYAHMIMKLNNQLSTDKNWLSALSHAIFRRGFPYALCCARIANRELLVKIQYRISLFHDDDDHHHVQSAVPRICSHWDSSGEHRNLKKLIDRMLFCSSTHEATKDCALCTSVIECRWCVTEFVVSIVKSAWLCYEPVVYITAWRYLGPCQTPFDMYWRTHTSPKCERPPPSKPLVHFTPGSNMRAFEWFGTPNYEGDEITRMSPLDSDVEYRRRLHSLDECPRRDSALSSTPEGPPALRNSIHILGSNT